MWASREQNFLLGDSHAGTDAGARSHTGGAGGDRRSGMTVMLFLVPIVAQRRSDPGEDLLSALIHPPEGGVTLETDEIVTMCLLLLAAGHETTANLIGNGTLALFEHPEQLDWLKTQHPDVPMQAVDELLRYDSPVQVASRAALSDLTLGGPECSRDNRRWSCLAL